MSSGDGETKKEMESAENTAAAAGAEVAPHTEEACPQPPYDQDFNPFSDEDKQRILHEEECSDPDEGWKFVNQTEHTKVWRKSDPSKPVHLVKAFMQFPGIPADVVAGLVHNTQSRMEWDPFFDIVEVIEEHKNFRVMYWKSKMPLTVSDRDLVQFIRRDHDESTSTTFFLYRNATHPKAPERRGIVRAETILSGVIVRPASKDPGSSEMSLMLQTDMKGWIPHFIVNAMAARSPKQWRDSLANYYHTVYSKELEKERSGDKDQEEEKGEGEKEEEKGDENAEKL